MVSFLEGFSRTMESHYRAPMTSLLILKGGFGPTDPGNQQGKADRDGDMWMLKVRRTLWPKVWHILMVSPARWQDALVEKVDSAESFPISSRAWKSARGLFCFSPTKAIRLTTNLTACVSIREPPLRRSLQDAPGASSPVRWQAVAALSCRKLTVSNVA
jgi:hypothetical protein